LVAVVRCDAGDPELAHVARQPVGDGRGGIRILLRHRRAEVPDRRRVDGRSVRERPVERRFCIRPTPIREQRAQRRRVRRAGRREAVGKRRDAVEVRVDG
jgi:hypothetical protein